MGAKLNKMLKGTGKIISGLDSIKQSTEPYLDNVLMTVGTNVAYLQGINSLIGDADLSSPTTGILYGAAGAAQLALNYSLFSKDSVGKKVIKGANNLVDRIRPLSWTKTAALTTLVAGQLFFSDFSKEVYQDVRDVYNSGIVIDNNDKVVPSRVSNLRVRPSIYDDLGYEAKYEHDFSGVKLADKETSVGKLQRALRWKSLYNAVEKKRGLKKNTLGAMAIQESYGNPVLPNSGNDGGLGICHIQGTVAKEYGLYIYGTSKKDSDKKHGLKLRDLIKRCNHDPSEIQKYDERGHILKVFDAAGRIVKQGSNAYGGSNDKGVQFYRAPGKVGKRTCLNYLARVRKWRNLLDSDSAYSRAAKDFESRNGYSFKKYLNEFDKMANNWGLDKYKKSNLN